MGKNKRIIKSNNGSAGFAGMSGSVMVYPKEVSQNAQKLHTPRWTAPRETSAYQLQSYFAMKVPSNAVN